MTVGERIQFHRKQKNLSQEELGQKLCISRQTVSLWEKDQTMPTVDNLLLLKDIFGITMDELLGVEAPAAEAPTPEEPSPLEEHTFTYEEAPLKKMYKNQFSILTLLLVMILAATVWAWLGDGDRIFVGIALCGVMLMLFILWNNFKERKHVLKTFPGRTAIASLYDGDLVLVTTRAGEKPSQICIPYGEIDNVVADVDFYQLHHGGKMYLFPMTLFQKGQFDPDSRLETLLKNNMAKNKRTPTKGFWRFLSFVLVYLCVLSPFLGILAAAGMDSLLGGDGSSLFDHFWIYFPMLVIPASSIAVGIYLRRKKKKAVKNIVAGVLSVVVLLGIGWGDVDMDNLDREYAEETFAWAECTIALVLPQTELMLNTLYEETETEEGYLFTSACIAVVTPSAREEFEATLTKEANWLEELSEELKSILPFEEEYDRILMYNSYTGEFNSLPEEEGWYQLACFLYDQETGVVTIWEFPWEKVANEQ